MVNFVEIWYNILSIIIEGGTHFMPIPIEASYMKRNYQLLAWVKTLYYGLDETFCRTSKIVYNWARNKCIGAFSVPVRIQSLNRLQTDSGKMLGVIYDKECHFFSLKMSHPDSEVAGRYWSVDVELSEKEGALHFGVRQSVSSPQSCRVPIPYTRPTFVKNICLNIGLIDCGKDIANTVAKIQTKDDIVSFAAFLSNLDRRLPVVAVTQTRDVQGNDGYIVNAQKVANDLLGYAHVVQLTNESTYMLTDLVGVDLSVYDGAVRTYYPGIVFNESNKYAHPLVTKRGLLSSVGPSDPPFEYRLEDYIKQNSGNRFVNWEDEGFQFYFQAEQKQLANLQKADGDIVQIKAACEERIKQFENSIEEYKQLALSYEADAKECQQDCDEMRKQINALKSFAENQKAQITRLKKGQEDEIPIDGSYANMVEWAEKYFPDRIYFHPRARKLLKSAVYKDVQLVYRCLVLLATDYYDFRLGIIDRTEFDKRCKSVDSSLEEKAAITDVSAGLQGETYFVSYAGNKEKLERHLVKGVSHNPEECLRIYFFWDNSNSLVVIGSLPEHLDTRAT